MRTADGPHHYTTGIIPPRPQSTPTTDISDEITEREPFDKRNAFRYTSNPYKRSAAENTEEDSDTMSNDARDRDRDHVPSRSPHKPRMTSKGIQTVGKTRNFGTMCELVRKRNSSNQASLDQKPTRDTSWQPGEEHPGDLSGIKPNGSQYSESPTTKPSRRSPVITDRHPPPQDNLYNRTPSERTRAATTSLYPNTHSTENGPNKAVHHHQRTPTRPFSPPTSNRNPPKPDPIRRTPSRSPERPHQNGHDHRLPEHQKPQDDQHPRHRSRTPSKIPVETDTSMDGVKISVNIGVQPEPKSTRDQATSPTLGPGRPVQPSLTVIRPQPQDRSIHSTSSDYQRRTASHTDNSKPNPDRFTPIYRENFIQRDDQSPSTRRSYLIRPVNRDDSRMAHSRTSSMYDVSTKTDPHKGEQHKLKPFIDDSYVSIIPPPDRSYPEPIRSNITPDRRHDSYTEKLRRDDSISIVPATVTEPDTLPRSIHKHQTPTRDRSPSFLPHSHVTNETLHRQDRFDQPASRLHRADENILGPSSNTEVATPFENRYVREPNRDFRTLSLNSPSGAQTFLLPVLNSSRTYVFERHAQPAGQVHQSPWNENFYLASQPVGSQFYPPEHDIPQPELRSRS